MNEYKSPFVNALAERWVKWRPMLKATIDNMDDRMGKMLINSALDTFNILNRMPELFKSLDEDYEKRKLIEGEIKALALEIDKEPPLIEKEVEPEPIPEPETEPTIAPDQNWEHAQPEEWDEPDNKTETRLGTEIDEPPSEELEPTFEVPEEATPVEPVHEVKFKKKKKRKKKAKNDT